MTIGEVASRLLLVQRAFNHQLLLELVNSGALEQIAAVRIANHTAEAVRELDGSASAKLLSDSIANAYEDIAAAVAGFPPIDKNG